MATPAKQRKAAKSKANSSPQLAKKKTILVTKTETSVTSIEQEISDTDESNDSPLTVVPTVTEKAHVFKNPNFMHSSIGSVGSRKTRVWKNLKQIVAAEKALPWQPDDTTYGMIDAPPSFKPAMKYSDISGLPHGLDPDLQKFCEHGTWDHSQYCVFGIVHRSSDQIEVCHCRGIFQSKDDAQ